MNPLATARALLHPRKHTKVAQDNPAHAFATRLPSRTATLTELKRVLAKSRNRGPVAIVIIEFSSALQIVTADPLAESRLVRHMGSLLRSWIPAEYVVGHLRGREFALIASGTPMVELQHMVDQVIEKMRTDAGSQNRQGHVATLAGVGYSSRAGSDADQLLNLADIALKFARSTGRNWHALVDDHAVSGAA